VPSDTRYSIEELGAATGMPVRRIRYYQTHGVLDPPHREGRSGYYDQDHLRRVQLIAELHGHGLRLAAIDQIVRRQHGVDEDLRRLLRTQSALAEGWKVNMTPRQYTADEIESMLGRLSPDDRQQLFEHEFIKLQPDGSGRVEQPAILEISIRLLEVGVTVETAAVAGAFMQPALGELADDLVTLFLSRVGAGFTHHGTPEEIDQALTVLRPAAAEAAAAFLTRFIGESIERHLDTGGPSASSS